MISANIISISSRRNSPSGTQEPNNVFVQGVIDKATVDGVSIPNANTINALNTFFNSLESVMSKAEMIKIGKLWDGNGLAFSAYNFVNPSTFKDTYPAGNPVYGLNGWSSDGTTYINNGITIKRRENLQLDSSSITVTQAFNNASSNQVASGCSSGNIYAIRPYLSGGGIFYMMGVQGMAPADTTHTVFTALSTNGASGTRPRLNQNGNFGTGTTNITTEFTDDIPIFTGCLNNAGTPTAFYTQGNVCFRWEGYELEDEEVELIRAAWNQYVIDVSQTEWEAGDDITSDGKEVWLICGDSKTGTSDAVGRYAAPDSVLQYRRSNGLIEEVKGADLFNIPSTGSPWPLAGRLYNESEANKGKRIVFALYGVGGSAFLNDVKNASWDIDDSGTVYASAKAVWDDALDEVGVIKPKAIVIILGINDINESFNISLTEEQIENVFNQLNTDYGSPTIYVSLPSVLNVDGLNSTQQSRLASVRAKLQSVISSHSNVLLFQDESLDVFDNATNTNSGTHWNFAGNEVVAHNLMDTVG
jgi:lysophospholipase L1-like esterase